MYFKNCVLFLIHYIPSHVIPMPTGLVTLSGLHTCYAHTEQLCMPHRESPASHIQILLAFELRSAEHSKVSQFRKYAPHTPKCRRSFTHSMLGRRRSEQLSPRTPCRRSVAAGIAPTSVLCVISTHTGAATGFQLLCVCACVCLLLNVNERTIRLMAACPCSCVRLSASNVERSSTTA